MLVVFDTLKQTFKKRSAGPWLIWPIIAIGVAVVFEILALTKGKAHSELYEGTCSDRDVVFSIEQTQMIFDVPVSFGKNTLEFYANYRDMSHIIKQ